MFNLGQQDAEDLISKPSVERMTTISQESIDCLNEMISCQAERIEEKQKEIDNSIYEMSLLEEESDQLKKMKEAFKAALSVLSDTGLSIARKAS